MNAMKSLLPARPEDTPVVDAMATVESLAEAFAEQPARPCRPTQDEIRVLAYHKWVAAGCPPGDGVCFWLEAEKELLHQNQLGYAANEHQPCASM